MNRLVRPDRVRSYDLADAVSYLRYYIRKNGRSVHKARIERWCKDYQKDTSDDVIRAVNGEYKRLYGEDGISG